MWCGELLDTWYQNRLTRPVSFFGRSLPGPDLLLRPQLQTGVFPLLLHGSNVDKSVQLILFLTRFLGGAVSSWICGYLGVLTGTSYSSVDPLCVWYFRGVFAASFIHLSYCPTESLPSAIRRLSPWALRLAGLLVEFSLCSSFIP